MRVPYEREMLERGLMNRPLDCFCQFAALKVPALLGSFENEHGHMRKRCVERANQMVVAVSNEQPLISVARFLHGLPKLFDHRAG